MEDWKKACLQMNQSWNLTFGAMRRQQQPNTVVEIFMHRNVSTVTAPLSGSQHFEQTQTPLKTALILCYI